MEDRLPLQIQAYNYLKEQILADNFEANMLYSETKIAKEMGISRTPVRDAIRSLSQDGYISVVPSKGFMICHLGAYELQESIQVRCAIEGFCIHIIAKEADSEKGREFLSNIETVINQQKDALEVQDIKAFMEYDHQFHLLIVHYVNNQEFNLLFQKLMYLIHLTTQKSLSIEGRIEETLKEHQMILEDLKNKRDADAYASLIDHLTMPLKMSIAILKEGLKN